MIDILQRGYGLCLSRWKTGFLSFYILLFVIIGSHAFAASIKEQEPYKLSLSNLKTTLQKEGFDKEYLDQIFSDKRVHVDMNVLRLNIFPSEKPADYDVFLTTKAIQRCKIFLKDKNELLEKVEKEYGVEKEIITAIILVESWFGKHTGRHRVFNVYSSLAAANTAENTTHIYSTFKSKYPEVSLAKVKSRIKKRSIWAFKELIYLLKLGDRENFDILELNGSWAGAFGLPQFLPSSFSQYAVDGDGDNKVDLYNTSDAVASVANYLKSMGWRPEISHGQQRRLIKTYNNSGLYAKTILRIATKIKKTED